MIDQTQQPSLVALKGDAAAVRLEWSDGLAATLPWRLLRDRCPCASCRAKLAEPASLLPVLRPEEMQPIRATSMQPVGNYAYSIAFSDGHNSGIYTVESLYALSRNV